jgi:hypothetical protein
MNAGFSPWGTTRAIRLPNHISSLRSPEIPPALPKSVFHTPRVTSNLAPLL